jgi:hypothetical protein
MKSTRACSSFPLNSRGLFTKKSSWEGEQSIPHSTVTFNGDCVKMYEDFNPNFGNEGTGCCITTTHHLTLFLPGNFFTRNNMTIVPHSHFFSPFPQLKIQLKGGHFDTIEVMEAKSQDVLNALTEHDFHDAVKKWQKHWERSR